MQNEPPLPIRDTFSGTYEELQAQLGRTGIAGVWRDLGNQKQFRAETGAILNWWESTKTLFPQGNPEAAKELMAMFAIVRGNIFDIFPGGIPSRPIRSGPTRVTKKHKRPKRLNDYPKHLQGPPQNRYGGYQTQRQRALKGSTFGAANKGRSYSPEEIKTYEEELRRKGILESSPELAKRRA